jgi:predicted secreted protein
VFHAVDYIVWRYKLNAAIWKLVAEEKKSQAATSQENRGYRFFAVIAFKEQ